MTISRQPGATGAKLGRMQLESGYWQDLRTPDFAGLDPATTVALLPVAAIEQHGPHLPLATDAVINAAIVSQTLARLPRHPAVLVLPAMNVGSSLEHRDFAGTLDIAPEVLLSAWKAIGSSVARAGIRKLVIFNSHGGQKALVDLAALSLRAEFHLFVVRANYFSFGMPAGLFSTDELAHDVHGGAVETSLMLHLRPDLVRREAIQDFAGLPSVLAAENALLGAEKPVGFAWMSQDLHASGACGHADRADPARGAAYLEFLASRLVTLLGETAAIPLSHIEHAPLGP